MKNLDSTRAYSDMHEKSVCKALNATQQPNSGGIMRAFWADCAGNSWWRNLC